MKRIFKTILFIIFILKPEIGFGQWSSLGLGLNYQGRHLFFDSTSNSLIAIGNFTFADSLMANHIARWDGTIWNNFGSGSPCGAPGYSITKYQNQFYFSSIFYNINNDNWLAKWNGVQWDTITPAINGAITCFAENNGDLYLGGHFTKIGNLDAPHIAKFNGNSFSTFPFPASWGTVLAISFYQGQIYLGGNFYDSLSNVNDLELFNGTNFNQFGTGGLASGSDLVSCFEIFNNELYIGGSFSTATGSIGNNIMRWDGSNMKPLLSGTNGMVSSMHVYNNSLYVCGPFTAIGASSFNGIARWDGTSWNHVIPNTNFLGVIDDFVINGNELYIIGSFDSIYGLRVNNIAKYSFPTIVNENLVQDCSIYPNPVNSKLFINVPLNHEIKKIVVNDLKGQIVISKLIQEQNNNIISLDVSKLTSGVYVLSIFTEKKKLIRKFVKL